MTPTRSIDTAPHPDFRHYSAGNFAEIAPPRWSVMTWSLVGDPAERGLRGFTTRVFPTARWTSGSHYVFVGYFSCRPYHNLSGLCHLAQELPGLKPQDVTRAYFEDIPPPERDLRAHSTALQRVLAVPRMAREYHRLRLRMPRQETDVALREEEIVGALQSGLAVALGCATANTVRTLDDAWDLHYSTSSSLVPAGALQRELGRRSLHDWDELEPLVTRPPELPWSRLFDGAGAGVEASRFLEFPFYEVADAFEPWASLARPFAPRAPTEHSGRIPQPEEIAEVAWRMNPGMRRLGVEQVSRAVSDTLQAREESKALAMRCLHTLRRALPTLAREAGLEADAWAYLRIAELVSTLDRTELAELAERRRAECMEALREDVPDELVVPLPGDDRPAATHNVDRGERKPAGVSPGVVTGRIATLEETHARVTSNGSEANGGGGAPILVCESADAGIQTLLPHIAGLITLRGSMLSHISTLAREYGIPTVVNHPLAETLRAGQEVLVNGSTGEVEVIP